MRTLQALATCLLLLVLLNGCRADSSTVSDPETSNPSPPQALLPLPPSDASTASPPSESPSLFPICGDLAASIDHGLLPPVDESVPEIFTASKETHRYGVDVEAGEYLHIVVEQHQADLVLGLVDSAGKSLMRVDSLYFDRGIEEIHWVATDDDRLQLLVCGPSKLSEDAGFKARAEAVRPVSGRDEDIAEAFQYYHAGEAFRRLGTSQALSQALELYADAATQWQQLGMDHEMAIAMYATSRLLTQLERDPEETEAIVLSALEFLQSANDRILEGGAYHRLGLLASRLGKEEEAISNYKKAIEIRQETGHLSGEQTTTVSLAIEFSKRGEFSRARDLYQRSLALARQLGRPHREARMLKSIAAYYLSIGDPESALENLEQALTLAQDLKDKGGIATLNTSLGRVYLSLERYEEAQQHFNVALELYIDLEQTIEQARVLNSLGNLELKINNHQSALEYFNQSLEILPQDRDTSENLTARLKIGHILGETGRCAEALKLFEDTARGFTDLAEISGASTSHQNLAGCHLFLGNLKDAHKHILQDFALTEFGGQRALSMNWKAKFFASRRFTYDLLVDVLVERAKTENAISLMREALEVSEKSKARALLDELANAAFQDGENRSSEVRSEVQALERQISHAQSQRLLGLGSSNRRTGLSASDAELRELLEKYEIVTRTLRAKSPRQDDQKLLGIEEIRRELPSDTSLLEFHVGHRTSHLWLLDSTRLLHFSLPKRAELEGIISTTYKNLSSKARPVQTEILLERLSEILFPEVFNEVRTRRIIIVLDGPLHYIPLDSLPYFSSTEPMVLGQSEAIPRIGDRFEVIMAPSISVLSQIRSRQEDRPPNRNRRITVVADPVFDLEDERAQTLLASAPLGKGNLVDGKNSNETAVARLERLEFSRMEAESISQTAQEAGWTSEVLVGFGASKAQIQHKDLSNNQILHFATHADFNSRQPEFAYLVLSRFSVGLEPTDGYLFAYELDSLDLPIDTVVLSACSSALGSDIRGEGLVGLTQGFFQAGASRVLVSLWQVDDRATAELMRHFYHYLLAEGLEPASALWKAKDQIRNNPSWHSPYFWSGFTLQGDW